VAKWAKEAMRMGRHVVVSDVDKKWVDGVANEFGFMA
jgi:hypothetical protein